MMNARNRTRRGVLAVGAVLVLALLATAASAIASAIYCGGAMDRGGRIRTDGLGHPKAAR